MPCEIRSDAAPLEEGELERLEREIGPLPNAYRRFLLEHGSATILSPEVDGKRIELFRILPPRESSSWRRRLGLSGSLLPIVVNEAGPEPEIVVLDASSDQVYLLDDAAGLSPGSPVRSFAAFLDGVLDSELGGATDRAVLAVGAAEREGGHAPLALAEAVRSGQLSIMQLTSFIEAGVVSSVDAEATLPLLSKADRDVLAPVVKRSRRRRRVRTTLERLGHFTSRGRGA